MTVQFTDVGPRKLSWSADMPALTYAAMMKQICKHSALCSRDVDFSDNGAIYVGMFRRVGSWAVADPSPVAPEEDRT